MMARTYCVRVTDGYHDPPANAARTLTGRLDQTQGFTETASLCSVVVHGHFWQRFLKLIDDLFRRFRAH